MNHERREKHEKRDALFKALFRVFVLFKVHLLCPRLPANPAGALSWGWAEQASIADGGSSYCGTEWMPTAFGVDTYRGTEGTAIAFGVNGYRSTE